MIMASQWLIVFFALNLLSASFSKASAETKVSEIDSRSIDSISYLVATETGIGQSSFGHAYLRLNRRGADPQDDPTFEFYADLRPGLGGYLSAAGLGSAPNRKMSVKPFKAILTEITVSAGRGLLDYQLNLDTTTVSLIVFQLNRILKDGGYLGDYNFFSSNCASAVRDLFKGAGIPLDGWTDEIPIGIPELLKEKKLISRTKFYPPVAQQRRDLTLKFKFLLDRIQLGAGENAFEMLNSPLATDRLYAWLKIREFKEPKLKILILAFPSFENALTKHLMMDQADHLRAQPLRSFNVTETLAHLTEEELRELEQNMVVKCNQRDCLFIAEPAFSSRNQKSLKLRAIDFTAKGGKIFFMNNEVGFFTAPLKGPDSSKATFHETLMPTMNLIKKFSRVRNEIHLSLGLLIDQSTEYLPLSDRWIREQIGVIRNISPERPKCAGLVLFQKLILENVIFDPTQPRLTDQANLQLINDLLSGLTVVIPGYASAGEFTAALNSINLERVLYDFHKKYFVNWADAFRYWLALNPVNGEELQEIRNLLDHGIAVPVSFQVQSRNPVLHAFLLTHVTEKQDRWVFSGYDPNLGWTSDLAYLRKSDFKFVTLNYGTTALGWKPLRAADEFSRLDLTRGLFRPLLLGYAKRLHKYSFSKNELMTALTVKY